MKTTISDAAAQTGITRSTIYKWIALNRLRQDTKGRVDTVVILKLKKEKKTGRPYGPINRGRVQTDERDPEKDFLEAVNLLVRVVESLPAERRRQVREAILPELPKPRLKQGDLGIF